MAFPASQQTLEDALAKVRQVALRIQSQAQNLRTRTVSESVAREDFVVLQRQLDDAIEVWDAATAVPGLLQYARDQYNDQTLDISTEYTAMRAAAIDLRDWIFNNIPTSAGGAVELKTNTTAGDLVDILVTPAQAAGFRTEADAFTATIS